MPRVVLAPIFMVWFGLGIWSKVALGVTLVFFIVFFNVYQGVKEVSPVVLNNATMLGANRRQLLRYVYLPSATSWVFSSLHTSVGMAFVGAVVGEYLGSAKGVGYLIHQAEGAFDINTVFAGHPRAHGLRAGARLRGVGRGEAPARLAADAERDGAGAVPASASAGRSGRRSHRGVARHLGQDLHGAPRSCGAPARRVARPRDGWPDPKGRSLPTTALVDATGGVFG